MKILITGISGFVGWHVNLLDRKDHEIFGTYHSTPVEFPNVRTIQVDLEKKKEVDKVLNEIRPEAILHLAALSNPNTCAKNPSLSRKANVLATQHILEWCVKEKCRLIFASTDLVFDGLNPTYKEDATCHPVNVYGEHKLEAEQMIMQKMPGAAIARLPLMYGLPENEKGYLSNWVGRLKRGEVVHAFTDEFRTQVWALDALKGMLLLAEQGAMGIYHLGGKSVFSRFDFIVKVAKALSLDSKLVHPSKQVEVQMPAQRPPDVSLDSEKAFALGYQPIQLRDFLERVK